MTANRPSSRHDSGGPQVQAFIRAGRRRWRSGGCRHGGHRMRHPAPAWEPLPQPPRPVMPAPVDGCPSCQQRYLGEQFCAECRTFCGRLGYGALGPRCDEPIRAKDSAEMRSPNGTRLHFPRYWAWPRVSRRPAGEAASPRPELLPLFVGTPQIGEEETAGDAPGGEIQENEMYLAWVMGPQTCPTGWRTRTGGHAGVNPPRSQIPFG